MYYLLSRWCHADTSVELPFVLFAPHTQWCCVTYCLVCITQTLVLSYLLSRWCHADTSVELPFVLFAPHTQWCCPVCAAYAVVLSMYYLLSRWCHADTRLHHADTSVELPFVLFAPHTQWCCVTYCLVCITQTLVLSYLLSCLRRIRSGVVNVLPTFSLVSRRH